MVDSERLPDGNTWRVIIRPNKSASWRQSMVFLAAITVPLVLVAGALASRGYWMILPFAGLELVVVFAALYLVSHAARRCEVVTIGETLVAVEKGRERGRCSERGGPETRTEFARGWVRVEMSQENRRWYPGRLWIGASGQRVELGEFLVEREKIELGKELQRLLSSLPGAGIANGGSR